MTLLKRHIAARGMEQVKLAKMLGVSPAAVSGWMTGQTTPKVKYLPKIARVLDMDPMALTRLIFPETETAGAK